MANINSISSMLEKEQDDLLYNLYLEHVKNEIYIKIKPEIDKVINQCLNEAVKSLEGTIRQMYDPTDYSKTFKIILIDKRNNND